MNLLTDVVSVFFNVQFTCVFITKNMFMSITMCISLLINCFNVGVVNKHVVQGTRKTGIQTSGFVIGMVVTTALLSHTIT